MRDYPYPEGTLDRPLLLPRVDSFHELFATSHRIDSLSSPREPMFPPREIHTGYAPKDDYRQSNEIGPFCSVKSGGQRWYMDVVANDAVIAAVTPRIVTPNDSLSFEIIEHARTGLALVILQHGYIIGSHWLAYIDPATIPYRPAMVAA